jgi:hypothetical protein
MMQDAEQFCLGLHLYPEGGNFSIPDVDADPGMTGLALNKIYSVIW